MRKIAYAILISTLLLLQTVALAESFSSSLFWGTIALGEQDTLSLIFDGKLPANLQIPKVAGLEFVQSGTEETMVNSNGLSTLTSTVKYTITPQHLGSFIIPPIEVNINGQRLITKPLTLTVATTDAVNAEYDKKIQGVAFLRVRLKNHEG